MRVLFICTGNTCRSPMAEAVMRAIAEKNGWQDFSCASAGLYAIDGQPLSAGAGAALARRGITFSHAAQSVTGSLVRSFDLVVAVTEAHRALFVQRFGEQVPCVSLPRDVGDPIGGGEAVYARSLAAIEAGIEELIETGVIGDGTR